MNKKNFPLYIALCVPVLMIILVAAFIYLPGALASPKQNFIYESGDSVSYDYGNQQYQVTGGHLVQNPPQMNTTYQNGYAVQVPVTTPQVTLYLYSVSSNEAMEITYDQAQLYTLDNSNTSSDGYTISQGSSSGGGMLYGSVGSDYYSWFIKGHNRSKKLNLKLNGTQNYSNFKFLGWVK